MKFGDKKATGFGLDVATRSWSDDDCKLLADGLRSRRDLNNVERLRANAADRLEDALAWLRIAKPLDRQYARKDDQAWLRFTLHAVTIAECGGEMSPEEVLERADQTGELVVGISEEARMEGFEDIRPEVINRVPIIAAQMIPAGSTYKFQGLREVKSINRRLRTFMLSTGEFDAEANYGITGLRFASWDSSSWWVSDWQKYRERVRPLKQTERRAIKSFLLDALEQRYDWHVLLRWGASSPWVMVETDASGARELFSDREPRESGRKSALRNWVSGHWRKRRNSPADSSWVIQHLRGAERFSWHGYECVLQPSDYDIERAHAFKVARDAGCDEATAYQAVQIAMGERRRAKVGI